MKRRKSPLVDLENKRFSFFLMGLSVALMLMIIVVNWKTVDIRQAFLGNVEMAYEEEEVMVTQRSLQKPSPPPKVQSDKVEIVDDIIDLKVELVIDHNDIDDSDEIEDIDVGLESTDEILRIEVVENKPIFPGCENETNEVDRALCFQKMMQQHIANNFKFPELSKRMKSEGMVIVYFVINKDGSISDVEVVKGVDEALDEEARRVINQLPTFEPAKQRGRPVRMGFKMPINARIK